MIKDHEPPRDCKPGSHEQTGTVLASLRILGVSCLALMRDRLELFSVEWQEGQACAKQVLLVSVACLLLLSTGLLLLALFVVMLFWDTHRLLAASAVTLVYLGASIIALIYLHDRISRIPLPFAVTLGEFTRDIETLQPAASQQSVKEHSENERNAT